MVRVQGLAVCGEGPRVSRIVRTLLGLGIDVYYIILFISTVTMLLSLLMFKGI